MFFTAGQRQLYRKKRRQLLRREVFRDRKVEKQKGKRKKEQEMMEDEKDYDKHACWQVQPLLQRGQ